jgi:hypothetical protein
MDTIAKGGRGNKAPYATTHARIPKDIKSVLEKLASEYRKRFVGNVDPDTNGTAELLEQMEAAIACASPTLEEQLNRELVEVKNDNWLLKEQCRILEAKLEAIPAVSSANASSKVSPRTEIDYAAVRDRILSQWRVGKRAESKERIKEALDKFIAELES